MNVAAGAVGTVEKPERFLRRLFQAAVEMIKKKSPKATLIHFHGGGSFPQRFPPGVFLPQGGDPIAGKRPSFTSRVGAIVVYGRSRGTKFVGGPVLTLSNR